MNQPGTSKISYYGHSCFLIEQSDNKTILLDPYRNREDKIWFKRKMPIVKCDICLITHAHFDHDEVHILEETTTILRLPGEFKDASTKITGIGDIHAGRSGKLNFPNIMFKIETPDLSFLHWGDNRPNVSDEKINQLKDVDILFIPVDDSFHLLKFEEIDEIIKIIKPKIIIPMHYFMNSISHEQNGLLPIDNWVTSRTENKVYIDTEVFISRSLFPKETEIWIMNI